MKIARLDTLPNQDALFVGTEDPNRYYKRQHIAVEDDYDFVGNSATDVSSILNWDSMSHLAVDYIIRQDAIQAIVIATGYANLSDDEKRSALKYFAGGAGNDYLDPLFTTEEYDAMYKTHRERKAAAAAERDDVAYIEIAKTVMQGGLPQSQAEEIAADCKEHRDEFTRDMMRGIVFGDAVSHLMDWMQNTNGFSEQAITAIDSGANTITVAGKHRKRIRIDSTVYIDGHTTHDGFHVVDSVAHVGDTTVITVESDLTDVTIQGDVFFAGLKSNEGGDVVKAGLVDSYNGKNN